MSQKIERIQELVKLCNYHSKKYYTEDRPEISDKEYDKLYNELESLEKETGYILSSSPTQKVQGDILPFLTKVKHSEPMLSADKSKDIKDVLKFMNNQECVLSWKLDGLTLVLRYDQGKLQQAITRGSGTEGEDVTHSVKTFTNVPLTIDYKGYLELRGEGLVLLNELEKVNAELISKGEETYSNCRNLASGSVRQLNSKVTKSRNMIFIAFGIVNCEEKFTYKTEQLSWLKKQGFEVVYHEVVDKTTLESWDKIFLSMIPNLSFLTDGLIVEFNDLDYGKSQGVTGHHSKALFAKKWNDDSYKSKFKGVELNTTRTSMTSITALFDEVEIDGVKVSRASLHNYDIFESLQLGIGDTISVYRANQVIPQIEDNLTRSNTYKLELKCPSCEKELVIKRPKEARFLFCENEDCSSKLINKFVHFVNKDAMNIEGLSEVTLEKFINNGWLKTFADIYKFENYKSQIVKMEGFGLKSYNKLIEAINKSKNVKLENFIVALGIPQIGRSASKTISKYFKGDWFEFEKALCYEFDFTKLEDFGDITNQSLHNWYDNFKERQMWTELTYTLNFIKDEKKVDSNLKDLSGLSFVVTGNVTTFKNRDEFKILVESLNGKVAGSVSNKTNYLVNNDVTSTSGKNKTAKDLGVQIISEADFNLMIGRS